MTAHKSLFAGRILSFDEKAELTWGELMAQGKAAGRPRRNASRKLTFTNLPLHREVEVMARLFGKKDKKVTAYASAAVQLEASLEEIPGCQLLSLTHRAPVPV